MQCWGKPCAYDILQLQETEMLVTLNSGGCNRDFLRVCLGSVDDFFRALEGSFGELAAVTGKVLISLTYFRTHTRDIFFNVSRESVLAEVCH